MNLLSIFSLTVLTLSLLAGCVSTSSNRPVNRDRDRHLPQMKEQSSIQEADPEDEPSEASVILVAAEAEPPVSEEHPVYEPLDAGLPLLPKSSDADAATLELNEVIMSVYATYPLLEAAFFGRNIAQGNYLSAQGNFDLKLKAASENGPTGFYETYRQSFGFDQPIYSGGNYFGGYRVGRGEFQPWYLERQTNDGGEFKAGLVIPLLRDANIDSRRAELWRTAYGTQLVEPEIKQQLIEFVRQASYAYWDWIAAGQYYEIQRQVLELAVTRNKGLEREVELGSRDPPDLQDNQRLIVSREAMAIDARRKLQQSAAKLSIYYRDPTGEPIIPGPEAMAAFPSPTLSDELQLESDIQTALANRPELSVLEFLREQLEIDYTEAENNMLPGLDAMAAGSQDVGAPTSSKRDKSQFELEAGLYFDMPLQRRKARGKMQATEGKIAQVAAKRRITEDKVAVEVRTVYAAMMAAAERVEKAREAVGLANQMAEIERTKFDNGASDLLAVNLREQQAAEAAVIAVGALLEFHLARADYRAVLALDDHYDAPAGW